MVLKTTRSLNEVMNCTYVSLVVTEIGKGRLTVGKIYGGLLILENWKATKFGKTPMLDVVVSNAFIHTYGVSSAGHLKNFPSCLI